MTEYRRDENEGSSPENGGGLVETVVSRGLWMGETEVTQQQWQQVMGANPSSFLSTGKRKRRVIGMDTSLFPVESVSWYDCIDFCNRLSVLDRLPPYYQVDILFDTQDRVVKVTGSLGGYRLPTEAEWEYSCRAGTTTPFSFGTFSNGKMANVDGNFPYGIIEKGPFLGRPTLVGSYPPNPWGLHDMHGNVSEMCFDNWCDYLQPATSPVQLKYRIYVYRGGSWNDVARFSRSARRCRYWPDDTSSECGMRLAIDGNAA